MMSAAKYIAEADGWIGCYSSMEQVRHTGSNFGWRWASDVIRWEERLNQQPGEQRRSAQLALMAELAEVPAGTLTHTFYEAAYSAFCPDAP